MTHLRASDWEVRNIPDHGVALRLCRAWHYAGGGPNTSTYRHGIYPRGHLLAGDPYGATIWLPPTRPAAEAAAGDDWQGVLTLSRLVVDPEMPTNAASFLLGRSMRLIDRARWPVLVTWADTRRGHTGAIYRATNWTCDGPVPAGDTWVTAGGRQVTRKRGGVTLTRDQMTERGYRLLPAAPKIRFVHRAAT